MDGTHIPEADMQQTTVTRARRSCAVNSATRRLPFAAITFSGLEGFLQKSERSYVKFVEE